MAKFKYYALFEPDHVDGGFTVTFPMIKGCVTQGETLSEAILMAEDALKGHLIVLEEEGENIPHSESSFNHQVKDGTSLILIEVDTNDKEAV